MINFAGGKFCIIRTYSAGVVEKQSLEWQQAREQGKLMRREETEEKAA